MIGFVSLRSDACLISAQARLHMLMIDTLQKARMFEEDAELLPLLGGNDKVELLSTMSPEAEEAAVDEALAEFAPASEAEKEKVTKVIESPGLF